MFSRVFGYKPKMSLKSEAGNLLFEMKEKSYFGTTFRKSWLKL